jgi:hypothetical protein
LLTQWKNHRENRSGCEAEGTGTANKSRSKSHSRNRTPNEEHEGGQRESKLSAEQGKTRFFTAKTEWRWTEDGTREKENSTWMLRSKQDRNTKRDWLPAVAAETPANEKAKNGKPKNARDLKSTHSHRTKLGMKPESQNFSP